MQTTTRAIHQFSNELPNRFRNNNVRLSENLLERIINDLSQPGDTIFDPFAGFATTLVVAEKQGRIGYGVENNQDRCNYGRSLLSDPNKLIYGDIREVDLSLFPVFDFSISSPVFMHRTENTDPLSGHQKPGSYEEYLNNLLDIYVSVADQVRQGGYLVVEASNLKNKGEVTPFAWDLGTILSRALKFEGEMIVNWDNYGYGYDHSYCLVYRKHNN